MAFAGIIGGKLVPSMGSSGYKSCCVLQVYCLLCIISFAISEQYRYVNAVANITVDEGTVHIGGRKAIAETEEHFICATIDWWPPQNCDLGSCSWGNASLLNLDLNNTVLFNAVKAFSPLKIRLGSTLQDQVIYQIDSLQPCAPFVVNSSQRTNFSEGCLPLARWDELNSFFRKSRAYFTFGLNALNGKTVHPNNTATGPWDSTNAASLIRYSTQKGYNVYGWELGNELGGRPIGVGVAPEPYASDMTHLHGVIHKLYQGANSKPLTLAPGGIFERQWFQTFTAKTAGSLNVITHHIYNLGTGDDVDLLNKILNVSVLESGRDLFKEVHRILKNSTTVAWVGEAGGAARSGRDKVTNTFVMGFWYLDQLGMASLYDTKTYCRQTLVGGNYGLLNTTTFIPNPDYYSALLWHRLMGRHVLSTKFRGTKMIRAYAHCAKQSEGITILLMNLDGKTTVEVEPKFDTASMLLNKHKEHSSREEYHLAPKDGNVQSQTVLLNGQALYVDSSSGAIPDLKPHIVNSSKSIQVAPHSIVFVRLTYIDIPACH